MIENPSSGPDIWLLLDDRAGNRGQCLGVADVLGLPYGIRDLEYSLLANLPNRLLGASLAGLRAESRAALAEPWPDLVIAAGRRTAPVARAIKRRSGGRTALVQLMDPGSPGIDDFDLVAVPRHDATDAGPNIVTVTGAPHRITATSLGAAGQRWRSRFEDLPRPWIALIVGGSTRRRRFTDAMARDLGRAASRMAADAGGSLLITTSRRTGDPQQTLLAEIAVPKFVYGWGAGGENPYLGYLALADAVVVTGESVSMCSEACASTAPVSIYAPGALITPKHGRLHAELFEKGYARPFTGVFEAWTHPPLNAADDIVAAMRRRLPALATP
jgi:mitochondrial fission protein ELM1